MVSLYWWRAVGIRKADFCLLSIVAISCTALHLKTLSLGVARNCRPILTAIVVQYFNRNHIWKMIKAILVFNNHGKPRLSKFYQYFVSLHCFSVTHERI